MSGRLPQMLPAYGGHDIRLHFARFADIPAEDDRTPSNTHLETASAGACCSEGWVSLSRPASCSSHRSLSERRLLKGEEPREREGHPPLPTRCAQSLSYRCRSGDRAGG